MADGATRQSDERSNVNEGLIASREPRGAGAAPTVGAAVGRYVVLSSLGAGAMGLVLAAYDPELDRKIAITVLKDRRSAQGPGAAAP